MKKSIIALAVSSLATFNVSASNLEHMQVNFLKNNDSILKFDFEQENPLIEGFKNESNIISFQVPKSKSKLGTNYFEIGEGGINNIKLQERGNYLHVLISTDQEKKASYSIQGDKVSLVMEEKEYLTHEDFENITFSKSELFIDDIRFKKESDKQVRIDVSHDLKDSVYDVVEYDGGFIIYFDNASIPSRLFKNSNLNSFDLPIESYLTKVEDGKVKVDVKYNDDFVSDFVTTTQDNQLSIVVKGKKKVKTSKLSDDGHTQQDFNGDLVSFNFQNMDIEEALFVIAQKMKLNLVLGDTVEGQISLTLYDVPYDQALDVILRTKGLDKYVEGNIMIVAPMEEIAARKEFEIASKNKIQTIKPLETKEVQVNYAKVEDVKTLLDGLKSDRGRVMVDSRTNKVFIEDTDVKIVDMEEMIESIDVPIRQVSVEARIVYAKKSVGDSMGVRWQSGLSTEGGDNFSDNYNQVGDSSVGVGLGSAIGALGDGANTAAITLGFANANIEATLNAMESSGDVEIVARPLVIAADKQTSSIASGQEYPYREIDDEGEVTTSFKEIVLSLDVTPQITPDDKLILDLSIVQDSIAAITEAGPAVDTTNINSRVIVDNNETLVLGGVFKEDIVKSEEKVPLLGDIPLLGEAFKYSAESTEEVELLIFITPKILNGEEIINR